MTRGSTYEEVGMQPEQDFEQLKRIVHESAKHLLAEREGASVTTADIAADTNQDLPMVTQAVRSLADGHLNAEPGTYWADATIHSVDADLS
jgi:hypothetical protein